MQSAAPSTQQPIKVPPAIAKKMFETGQFSSFRRRQDSFFHHLKATKKEKRQVVDTENFKETQKKYYKLNFRGVIGLIITAYTFVYLTSSIYSSSKHRSVGVCWLWPFFFPTNQASRDPTMSNLFFSVARLLQKLPGWKCPSSAPWAFFTPWATVEKLLPKKARPRAKPQEAEEFWPKVMVVHAILVAPVTL